MGDANDPKCLDFHSVKLRKGRGGSTSSKGRAVLHQAADENFVWGQEASLEMWLSQEISLADSET